MMELNTTQKEYVETVQMIELYKEIQDIIDRMKHFELSEVLNDKEKMTGWLMQLQAIKEDTERINGMKDVLLSQSSKALMNFYTDD